MATMDCAAMSSAENAWMLKMKSCAVQHTHCQRTADRHCYHATLWIGDQHRHRACMAAQTRVALRQLAAQSAEHCSGHHKPLP